LTVGDEKSPNNNADRNYRTAGWGEITRKLRRCNHPSPGTSKKSAAALETDAHTAIDAVHAIVFAAQFADVDVQLACDDLARCGAESAINARN
jgi:hypothetical protein